MKRTALICFGPVVLSGCATAPAHWVSNASIETDSPRVAAVERAANTAAVCVIWINLPQKNAAPVRS